MRKGIPAFLLTLLTLVLVSGCTVYQSFGKSSGNFIRSVNGPSFQPVPSDEWYQEEHALVYFYRPDSNWARQELTAPSFYVDDRHYFNMRGNAYTWLEMHAGERQFDIRRPFVGFEGLGGSFDHILEATVELEAGEIYYLRYSEVDSPASVHPALDDDHPMASGDAVLVDEETALEEIGQTRFLESQLLALNSAGRSIAYFNRLYEFERREEQLKKEREEEIERMKARGDYRSARWYWPFGGGPTRPLESERELRALERERNAFLERSRGEDGRDGWRFDS